MVRVEYRCAKTDTLLFACDGLDEPLAAVRLCCHYFVKHGRVYEVKWREQDGTAYVFYVEERPDEKAGVYPPPLSLSGGFGLEVRAFDEARDTYPLLTYAEFSAAEPLLLQLLADVVEIGGVYWEKSSIELDEDRQTLVLYVKKIAKSPFRP